MTLSIKGSKLLWGGLILEFTIRTNKKAYRKYNGCKCRIVNAKRTDHLIEVYVPDYDCLILLRIDELED